MRRLQILLLFIAAVLATVSSTDDDLFNKKVTRNPNVKLTYSSIQRRRHQPSHIDNKEENVGRYFRTRPQSTTVPSIFSMKVENESQHVYPNKRPLVKHIQIEENQSHVDDTDISSRPSTINISKERVAMRTKNLQRRIPFTRRRHPAVAQQNRSFNDQQLEEHNVETENESKTSSTTTTTTTSRIPFARRRHPAVAQQITSFNDQQLAEQKVETENTSKTTSTTTIKTTSTTPAPIVSETTEKEQRREEPHVVDIKNFDVMPSVANHVSQSLKAKFQTFEAATEQEVTTSTQASTPIFISNIVDKMEESEILSTPSDVSHSKFHIRRRRPHFAKKVQSQPIPETLTINENVYLSTSEPTFVYTEVDQEKKINTPYYVSDLVSVAKKPKSSQRYRGSIKFSSHELRKEEAEISVNKSHPTLSQGMASTLNVENPAPSVPITSPPPAPTLSPWYDGFGK